VPQPLHVTGRSSSITGRRRDGRSFLYGATTVITGSFNKRGLRKVSQVRDFLEGIRWMAVPAPTLVSRIPSYLGRLFLSLLLAMQLSYFGQKNTRRWQLLVHAIKRCTAFRRVTNNLDCLHTNTGNRKPCDIVASTLGVTLLRGKCDGFCDGSI